MGITVEKHYIDGHGNHCVFYRLKKKTPGFSHRVVINGVAKYWLSDDHVPCVAVARYFLEKYTEEQTCCDCGGFSDNKLCEGCAAYREHTNVY